MCQFRWHKNHRLARSPAPAGFGLRKRWACPALCVKGRDVARKRFELRPVIAIMKPKLILPNESSIHFTSAIKLLMFDFFGTLAFLPHKSYLKFFNISKKFGHNFDLEDFKKKILRIIKEKKLNHSEI